MTSGRAIGLFVFLEASIICVAVVVDGFTPLALQTITRFSGRLSLFLFSIIFLLQHKPSTLHYWLSEKFYLLFAIVHGIHLFELLSYVMVAHVTLVPIRLAGGFLAYVFIFAMPILAHAAASGKFPVSKFNPIQTMFLYYVWLIFFLAYLPRVQGKVANAGGNYTEHVALLGWVSTMLGIRLANMIQFKRKS